MYSEPIYGRNCTHYIYHFSYPSAEALPSSTEWSTRKRGDRVLRDMVFHIIFIFLSHFVRFGSFLVATELMLLLPWPATAVTVTASLPSLLWYITKSIKYIPIGTLYVLLLRLPVCLYACSPNSPSKNLMYSLFYVRVANERKEKEKKMRKGSHHTMTTDSYPSSYSLLSPFLFPISLHCRIYQILK